MASATDPSTRTESHSGRLLLRMPRTLHAELAGRAEAEGVSLNQLIVGALSRAVGAQEAIVVPSPSGEQTAPPAAASEASESSASASPVSASPVSASPVSVSPVSLRAALVANLIVVLIAGVAAIVLLLVAWHRGF